MDNTLLETPLTTAEQFAAMPGDGVLKELVNGVVVPMNMPSPRHGEICLQAGHLLKLFLGHNRLGRAVSNDSGIVTLRDPDSVRGADIAFYSFARLPAAIPLPMRGYANVAPELVIEVRSYTDRWGEIQRKVGEYLEAGVDAVVVLDEQTERAWMYRRNDEPLELGTDDSLPLPPPLDGWQITVRQFFA
jgi:Uma2 family endonuclease